MSLVMTAPSARRAHDQVDDSGSLAAFMGRCAPHWHSQWAWDNYEATVRGLARQFSLTQWCEIGGGRDPLFRPGDRIDPSVTLTVNDIDAAELAAAPAGLATACFDIAGDLSEPDAKPGRFDLMFSRMVFEHVDGVDRAWRNIHTLLKPGGVALAFFPTLWAPVFTVNHLIPESVSRRLVHALYPNRRDGGGDPKFPALYSWCRSSGAVQAPMLRRAGFNDFHVQPFWGHGYFERMPGLRQIDDGLNRLAARLDWRLVSTYAFVLVRKAD